MISNSSYLCAKRNRDFASREAVKGRLASIYKHFAPTALVYDWRKGLSTLAAAVFVGLYLVSSAHAQAKRVVLLKVDGLPYQTVDRFVRERDPQTGKSRLPWFEHIFYQNGTRLTNFYVRGMSLSGPSWSLIDTGQHLQIKGNVEFDRYIFHTYD